MKRMTFYGRMYEYSEMSHQHLSNVLWFGELFGWYSDEHAQAEINERFGGIKLPYSPMISFKQEIDLLVQHNYVTNTIDSDIIVNGKWIGRLSYK